MHSRTRIAVLCTLAVVGSGLGTFPAAAGTATVKVSALTRAGQPMVLDSTLVNLATGKTYQVHSGGLAVPTGKYAVGAFINEYRCSPWAYGRSTSPRTFRCCSTRARPARSRRAWTTPRCTRLHW